MTTQGICLLQPRAKSLVKWELFSSTWSINSYDCGLSKWQMKNQCGSKKMLDGSGCHWGHGLTCSAHNSNCWHCQDSNPDVAGSHMKWDPATPEFESWSPQRKTISLLLIWSQLPVPVHNLKQIYIEGILPKGPYLTCVSMVGRALLAGYHRSRR